MKKLFKLGCYFDLFSTREADWIEEAEFNQQYKPEFLELMLEYPGSVQDFDFATAKRFQEIVSPIPLTVHGPTLNVSLCAGSRRIVDAAQRDLLDGLTICNWFGSKLYTLHGGEFPFFLGLNDTSPAKEFIKNIKPILDYASELGIKVCLENLKGEKIFPKTFSELDEVFDAHPSLMLAYDVRHFCVNNINVIEAYSRYKNRIPSIQYRDDSGLTDAELKEFLTLLIRDKWAGNFIIEDPALNVADKSSKVMLDAGYKRVTRILSEITEN